MFNVIFIIIPQSKNAAAKSLQSCPTLCDPIDGSPPGSPVPGILQARTLERVAISFSNAWKWKVKVKSLSRVRLLTTPWTVAYQAPPSLGCFRQEYWSGVPFPSWQSKNKNKARFTLNRKDWAISLKVRYLECDQSMELHRPRCPYQATLPQSRCSPGSPLKRPDVSVEALVRPSLGFLSQRRVTPWSSVAGSRDAAHSLGLSFFKTPSRVSTADILPSVILSGKLKAPVLWSPDVTSWRTGRDPDAEKGWRQEKGTTEHEMVGRRQWLNGHESEQTPGDGEGQGGLARCSPQGHKESDTTEWPNNKTLGKTPGDRGRT